MRALRAIVMGSLMAVLALGTSAESSAAQTMDQMKYLFVMVDELEQARGFGERPVVFHVDSWYGGDADRLWFKVGGQASTRSSEGDIEAQALFSRLVSPWWDLQMGLRVDYAWGAESRTRPHLVLGLQGLAPYWFEVESAVFVDVDGHVSVELSAAYDLLLSQSLILEPQVDVGLSLQDVPEWGVGAGFHDAGLAVRLRYEIKREFAPYVGWVWERALGATANMMRNDGAPVRQASFVFGVRAWY